MFDFVISLVVLAMILLLGGAAWLWRKGVRKQALLMAVLALVMAANVAIWLVPTQNGGSLKDQATAANATGG